MASYASPHVSQTQFALTQASTPPPPPPKPSGHSSGRGTPQTGPPLPPTPTQVAHAQQTAQTGSEAAGGAVPAPVASPVEPPEEGWLPAGLKDKTCVTLLLAPAPTLTHLLNDTTDTHTSTAELAEILESPDLQRALIYAPTTAHASLTTSTLPLSTLLAQNLALADSLRSSEAHLSHTRQGVQSRLLSLRALEAQWRAKQAEQDAALAAFGPPALYQRLSSAIAEQEALCRGLEESFLEGEEGGVAGEREVVEFVRRIREARKVAYLRRERKERWDEGRVGGWR
ncbi:uncharacterized protein K452DRAFT_285446 [Aplosporella prunicola CBS 121167]|uniref:VPS37 C-terminal domain-containing protein n=1 Tax=Aplosporella prunicola CBS 121167 TaxID=1176127 RepID=A0A6A6BLP7_9PEZI|nr:uncharacterized protein K452DRAFT_285446 [Aplosporella prunicola CBS 121167]KAF2144204.1 hypothetical protein K452DRAFT_285446 [Aplosporella prunicola CBS 121167]